jgi:hypothetical protein
VTPIDTRPFQAPPRTHRTVRPRNLRDSGSCRSRIRSRGRVCSSEKAVSRVTKLPAASLTPTRTSDRSSLVIDRERYPKRIPVLAALRHGEGSGIVEPIGGRREPLRRPSPRILRCGHRHLVPATIVRNLMARGRPQQPGCHGAASGPLFLLSVAQSPTERTASSIVHAMPRFVFANCQACLSTEVEACFCGPCKPMF